jgi:hypothetical protein
MFLARIDRIAIFDYYKIGLNYVTRPSVIKQSKPSAAGAGED